VERGVILGTAGHIDHGKTALVRALTGVDTDRLPEEKRRGITIDLGFAPLRLDGGDTIGVVDVPGHEAFVRTMLAGATGVDLALLVVAADEGVMPQTREHLAILDLLGVRSGIVVLTKCDLVDAEWRALVEDDVRQLVVGSTLERASVIATSATTGQGVDDLRRAIAGLARGLAPRDARDLFRMPVDRAFTIKGTGTVVTGTVWTGTVARDASVRILPGLRSARVRSVQTHGAFVDSAQAGQRTALALAGVDVADVARGSVLVTDSAWRETSALRADVALLEGGVPGLRARTAVRFHLATSDVGARIVAAGGPLEPGQYRPVRVSLDTAIVARAGDRFVIRSPSPPVTLGGGVVTDPYPARRAKPWPATGMAALRRLALVLEEASATVAGAGERSSGLPVRLGLPPDQVKRLVETDPSAVQIGDRVVAREAIERLTARLLAVLAAQHAERPLEPDASLQSIRARLRAPTEIVDFVLARQSEAGAIEMAAAAVRLAGWSPRLSDADHIAMRRLLDELRAGGREPASVQELSARHGPATEGLLRVLERDGSVVRVEQDRYYASEEVNALLARLSAGLVPGREYGPAELRELLGFSRKFLIPFLEYCDRRGYTVRRPGGRVWRGT
jgi:selenocysteine-specific elongation factor